MRFLVAALAAISLILHVMMSMALEDWQLVATAFVITPFAIGIYVWTSSLLWKRKGGAVAAFFNIQSAASCIGSGIPALLYMIWSLVRSTDDVPWRGKEFSGIRSPYMVVNGLLGGIASPLLALASPQLYTGLSLFTIVIAVAGAVNTENKRKRDLSLW